MIENTGGIGKPFDHTNYDIHKTYKMDDNENLKNIAQPNLGSETNVNIDKDVLDWQAGSKIQKNKTKYSLKSQIQESRKRLVESRNSRIEDAKKNKFIGKVTYELESYPNLNTNFDEMV